MFLANVLRRMRPRSARSRGGVRRAPGQRSRARPLVLEALEERCLLSVQFTAVAAGDATSNDAIIWTRAQDSSTTQGVPLIALVSTDQNFGSGVFYTGTTDPTRDYTLKVDATGLQSGTRYYYRFVAGDGTRSRVGTFKTAPDPTAQVPLHFGFSGDADGRWRPYDVTAGIAAQNFDFFTFLGDTIYETATSVSPGTADPYLNPAQALVDYQRKYLEQLQPVNPGGFPGLQSFFASQGNYTLLDNHELGNKQFTSGGAPAGSPAGSGVANTDPSNDVNTTGTFMHNTPGYQAMLQAFDDFQPVREETFSAPDDPRTDGTQQMYFAQQWGANSIFFQLDDRSYRDIEIRTTAGGPDIGPRADNPDRTMLGRTQLEWFAQSLLDAQANGVTWKFVAISSPIDQVPSDYLVPAGPLAKDWNAGYRAERNELLKFIADNHIDHVVFLTTDDHQVRISRLSYLTDPSDPTSVAPVPGAFQILTGPLGAGGLPMINDHSFNSIKARADSLAAEQVSLGMPPLGLNPSFPGLVNVFREGDPQADVLRQPVDFYSPDTFNYATLDVSADGESLTVRIFGINNFAANTFPEPSQVGPERLIMSFQVIAAPENDNSQGSNGQGDSLRASLPDGNVSQSVFVGIQASDLLAGNGGNALGSGMVTGGSTSSASPNLKIETGRVVANGVIGAGAGNSGRAGQGIGGGIYVTTGGVADPDVLTATDDVFATLAQR
jgi:phosphodiesterase/alkaline phosphatase D-like protein